eukprot:CAMPEP_0179140400 /NCGR_PEP_ID=MMETSP0796-20121207/67222_1 /TAXON_ID=73915 /ORGANISM="Pyrodinium bahamense, Strain pbaha01" /LENGTH=247 /DNA_ID=CAMNT_0020839933 /DNA_START=65 /DNA_END=805 /DNA_ORIENTATION=+
MAISLSDLDDRFAKFLSKKHLEVGMGTNPEDPGPFSKPNFLSSLNIEIPQYKATCGATNGLTAPAWLTLSSNNNDDTRSCSDCSNCSTEDELAAHATSPAGKFPPGPPRDYGSLIKGTSLLGRQDSPGEDFDGYCRETFSFINCVVDADGYGFNLKAEPGRAATVEAVVPGSHAEEAGIQIGDEIVEISGRPLPVAAELATALQASTAESRDNHESATTGRDPFEASAALQDEKGMGRAPAPSHVAW